MSVQCAFPWILGIVVDCGAARGAIDQPREVVYQHGVLPRFSLWPVISSAFGACAKSATSQWRESRAYLLQALELPATAPLFEGASSGGYDGAIHFWGIHGSSSPVESLPLAHEGPVWSLAWHPMGHLFVSASNAIAGKHAQQSEAIGKSIAMAAVAVNEGHFRREGGRDVVFGTLGEEDGHAALTFYPLGSSRQALVLVEEAANKAKLRLLCTNRPGNGSTSPPLDPPEGVSAIAWHLETAVDDARALLAKLQIAKVSILFFCAGTPFALRFASKYPELCTGRMLGVAPWVSPADCQETKGFFRWASSLPACVVSSVGGPWMAAGSYVTKSLPSTSLARAGLEKEEAVIFDREAVKMAARFREGGSAGGVAKGAVIIDMRCFDRYAIRSWRCNPAKGAACKDVDCCVAVGKLGVKVGEALYGDTNAKLLEDLAAFLKAWADCETYISDRGRLAQQKLKAGEAALDSEASSALGLHHTIILLDLKHFYDSVCLDQLVRLRDGYSLIQAVSLARVFLRPVMEFLSRLEPCAFLSTWIEDVGADLEVVGVSSGARNTYATNMMLWIKRTPDEVADVLQQAKTSRRPLQTNKWDPFLRRNQKFPDKTRQWGQWGIQYCNREISSVSGTNNDKLEHSRSQALQCEALFARLRVSRVRNECPEGDNEIYPTDTWIPKAVSMIHSVATSESGSGDALDLPVLLASYKDIGLSPALSSEQAVQIFFGEKDTMVTPACVRWLGDVLSGPSRVTLQELPQTSHTGALLLLDERLWQALAWLDYSTRFWSRARPGDTSFSDLLPKRVGLGAENAAAVGPTPPAGKTEDVLQAGIFAQLPAPPPTPELLAILNGTLALAPPPEPEPAEKEIGESKGDADSTPMVGLSLGEGPNAKSVLDTADFDAEERAEKKTRIKAEPEDQEDRKEDEESKPVKAEEGTETATEAAEVLAEPQPVPVKEEEPDRVPDAT
ncbi:pre-mRNA 3' end processing protein WDR33 [Symbiodinium microadriaticum]|uniref:Pre-mRNA 3' end processing protein WDR33 n=1 Tax=Symbiodinium microadriaticum TaxID=2951 RepID=A0A1Q9DAQ3_SYMMI|nr:pre-mRNA 3' end processing protein WDR33 [Symbiodinium microadriaticum]